MLVLCPFWLNDFFFSLWSFFFLLLCTTDFFYWISVIVNFTLLVIGYFYVLVSILELYFEMQLGNIETVWSFQGLLLRFVKWDQGSIIWEHNFAPLLRQYPFEYSTLCLVYFRVFKKILASGKMNHAWLCVSLACFPPDPFRWFLPTLCSSSYTCSLQYVGKGIVSWLLK